MKERGILFSGDNPKLIRNGRKTQTRRIMASKHFKLEMCYLSKPPHLRYCEFNYRRGVGLYESGSGPFDVSDFSEGGSQGHASTFCPYGVAGDRLWVRETFYCDDYRYPEIPADEQTDSSWREQMLYYRSTDGDDCIPEGESKVPWRPSIHMPRWASRITLEITKVRVERLQDISEEDAAAEGVTPCENCQREINAGSKRHNPHRHAYAQLWDSLHGKGAWDKNPWVWVIEFRRL